MGIFPVGAEMFHADGHMDRWTYRQTLQANSCFS